MQLSDFDYDLPRERIAQTPAEPRDAARLLVHDPLRERMHDARVADLAEWLEPGDLLVLNDTRVLPARLFARRRSGGAVELLFVEPCGSSTGGTGTAASGGARWRALVNPARKLRAGETLAVPGGLSVRVVEREGTSAVWHVELGDPRDAARGVVELLEVAGRTPLPPYIHRARDGDEREPLDRERYQTIYARAAGAVAAPTAGLHFTPELMQRLAARGVQTTRLTLHVGIGTFQPIATPDPRDHAMHAERFEIPEEAARAVERARARGARVVAVGTTSVRALEARSDDSGRLAPGRGSTDLFILPGHRFRCVDALLTNFHLPRSTLLMLVCAFAGRERVLRLYRHAVEAGYRFYSYGDAMLLTERWGTGSGTEAS